VPRDDPKDLQPPIKYKLRRARHLTEAEVKAAADRAEARSRLTQQTDDPSNSRGSNSRGIVLNPSAPTSVVEG
jgi:hypothetical protein